MNTRLQNLAAAHGALWSDDPWYRRSWFIWPLAMALLAAGWLTFHGAPAGPDSHAPWAVPAQEALSPHDMDMLRDSAKTDVAAFERLKALAASGDRNAQFSLGTLYDPDLNFSKLTNPDVNQAIAWYTKAAEQGHAVAQYNLGVFFDHGKFGVTRNFSTAFFWYQKSAAQGYASGERALAICYRTGNGVAADPVRATELFQSAANKGDAYSEAEIGLNYETGSGGLRADRSEAIKWYLKAADQGWSFGQMKVGEAYLNGTGLRRDVAQAFDLFQRAAQQDQPVAQFYLGAMYDQGLAIAVDTNLAFQWFLKAANNGNADAQNALGVAYAKGRGVAQNMAEARLWFSRAKANGNAAASNNLRMLR